jgi:hypothetical protein
MNKNKILNFILGGLLFIMIGMFACCFKTKDSTADHVSKALDYNNSATAIKNRGKAYEEVSQQDIAEMISYYKRALEEAKLADIESMNRHYRGFGDHFQQEFIKGLELLLEGYQPDGEKKLFAGQVLLDQFGQWYENHLNEIRKGMR